MNTFLAKHYLPKQTQEEIENLDRAIRNSYLKLSRKENFRRRWLHRQMLLYALYQLF